MNEHEKKAKELDTPMRKAADVLPDSRGSYIHTPKGMVQTTNMGTWVPVFCANCGVNGGHCPEENMNFLFYLCNKCAEKWGRLAGTMLMPDEVFFEKVKQEQLASYGRFLSPDEVAAVLEVDASPLAKLLKSGRNQRS